MANSARICGWGATFWCRNLLLSSNNFTYGHLVKIEWVVADVTGVGSLDRAKHAILGVIVAGRLFCQFRLYLWSRSITAFGSSYRAERAILAVVVAWRFLANSCRIYVYLSIYLFLLLSFYPPIHLSIYPSTHLSLYPSVNLSIYPVVYLCIYMSVCLSISLSSDSYFPHLQ